MENAALPSSTNASDPESEECHYLYDGSLWRVAYLTEVTRPNLIALTAINSSAVIPTILLNALIILALVTRHPLRTNSNKLVACLAGTGVLGGLVVQPIAIAVELKRIFGHGPFCSLEKASWVVMLGVSLTSLNTVALISIDRYIAIKHPLRYISIVTKQRIKTGILLVWVVGLFVTIQEVVLAVSDSGTQLYFRYLNVKDVILGILALFDIAVISYTYFYIFSETRRQNKRLKTEQLSQEEAKRLKKDGKASNTLTMILAVLVLGYLPTIILAIVIASTNNIIQPHIITVLWSWISIFAQIGFLFDPGAIMGGDRKRDIHAPYDTRQFLYF